MTNTPRVIHPRSLRHASVQMSMRSREAGETHVPATYEAEAAPNGRIVRVTVTVPVTVTLPEWPESSRLPPAARAEWNRFLRALDAHEQGHVRIARRYFTRIGQRMVGLTLAQAEERWQANLQAWREADREFDAQTDHGRNTGTIIDENVQGATTDVTATAPAAGTGQPAAGR